MPGVGPRGSQGLRPRHSDRARLIHQIDGDKLGAAHRALRVAAHTGGWGVG